MPIEFDQEIKRPDRPEVVVITGATAGVGRAVAHPSAHRGVHYWILAPVAVRPEATRLEAPPLRGAAISITADAAHARRGEAGATADEDAFAPIPPWASNAVTLVFLEIIEKEF